jgi:hypothetical protein
MWWKLDFNHRRQPHMPPKGGGATNVMTHAKYTSTAFFMCIKPKMLQ